MVGGKDWNRQGEEEPCVGIQVRHEEQGRPWDSGELWREVNSLSSLSECGVQGKKTRMTLNFWNYEVEVAIGWLREEICGGAHLGSKPEVEFAENY